MAEAEAEPKSYKDDVDTPEQEKWKKVDLLVSDELNDVLSDLTYQEITVISLYRSVDQLLMEFGGLPNVNYLFNQIMSLRRSKDRMGRQEIANILKGQPKYFIGEYGDEEGSGKLGKLKGLLPSGKKRTETEEEAE